MKRIEVSLIEECLEKGFEQSLFFSQISQKVYLGVLETAFQGMEAAKVKKWKTGCPVSQYIYPTLLSGKKNR